MGRCWSEFMDSSVVHSRGRVVDCLGIHSISNMAAPMHEFLSTWKSLQSNDLWSKHDVLESIIDEKQLFTTKDGQTMVMSRIGQLLSSSQTRLKGLVLLMHFMKQIQNDSLGKHIVPWIEQLTGFLQHYQPESTYQLTCRCLSVLVQTARRHPEQSHQASTAAVPNLYHALLLATPSWRYEAAQCLRSCLVYFPGPAGPVKEKLLRYLIPLLTSAERKVVEMGVECYCRLASVGGAGHQGSKHSEAWAAQFDQILASVRHIISTLYANVREEEDEPDDGGRLQWLCEGEEDVYSQVQRFSLAVSCAARMLATPVHYTRTVPVTAVIGVVSRCLSVQARMLEARPSTDRLRLASVISRLHQDAFNVLDALIACCRSNLLPHASTTSKMYLQTLSWTLQTRRQYCGLRMRVYSSMVTWLDHVTHGLDVDDLVSLMMAELKTETAAEMKLDATMNSLNSLMTKKKGKGKKPSASSTSAPPSGEATSHECVCSCLEALRALLRASGHRLKPSTLSSVEDLIIRSLLDWRASPAPASASPAPAARPDSRARMYGAARALAQLRHGKWSPALHVYMRIFTAGRNDPDSQVRAQCAEALSLCAASVHPLYPAVHNLHAPPSGGRTNHAGGWNSALNVDQQLGSFGNFSSLTLMKDAKPAQITNVAKSDLSKTNGDSLNNLNTSERSEATDAIVVDEISAEPKPSTSADNGKSDAKIDVDVGNKNDVFPEHSDSDSEEDSETEDQANVVPVEKTALPTPRAPKRRADSPDPDIDLPAKVKVTDADDIGDGEVDEMLMAFHDVGPDSDD